MLPKPPLLQPADVICLFPFHNQQHGIINSRDVPHFTVSRHVSSGRGQHQIQMWAKRSLYFSAADPGQSSASWQQRPESNQGSQTLFARATIRSVAFSLQTWCWAIRQPRLHPAMSSLRIYPHYTHSSQSAGYAGNQNPISNTAPAIPEAHTHKDLSTDGLHCITDFPSCVFTYFLNLVWLCFVPVVFW